MNEVTVEFAKKHIYGGHTFIEGDKLTLPRAKAAVLSEAGVLKPEKKAAKKSDD